MQTVSAAILATKPRRIISLNNNWSVRNWLASENSENSENIDLQKGSHVWIIFLQIFISLFQYLSKQNLALREVNDSRVKVYEQLEENISELEAANKKMAEEGKADKGKIKW